MKNIVLIGMPGCGKTTIGKLLAERLHKKFCDIDEYIEENTKKSIPEIFKDGESVFRRIERNAVEEISKKFAMIIATGGGVVKSFSNIQNLKKNGMILFINRPIEEIVADIDISNRPLMKDGKEKLYNLYEERVDLYKKYCDYEVMNDDTLEKVTDKIVNMLDIKKTD
ncbi:shikimate kinase [Crassaminicella profunda]|uniref:shikimate kinase n=1 Tax=Crassaminicella profunda TaxID=1286698 RepID=UPI001CA70A09|nr:shikimate kinase [Crassaminicella profunda]QZY53638.1 shikimate kinase [Crassaminicella profunda]